MSIEKKVAAVLSGDRYCEVCGIPHNELREKYRIGVEGVMRDCLYVLYVNKATKEAVCHSCRGKVRWYTSQGWGREISCVI